MDHLEIILEQFWSNLGAILYDFIISLTKNMKITRKLFLNIFLLSGSVFTDGEGAEDHRRNTLYILSRISV